MTTSAWDLIDASLDDNRKSLPAGWLPNGFYTLTFPDGSHRTFRVRTEQNGVLRGKRTLALLIGPVNTDDYEPFAVVTESGFAVWKKFARGGKHSEYAVLLWDIAKGEKIEGYDLHVSKRCLCCNHLLTDAVSIERGIGPLCWERMNGRQ